MAAAKLTTKQAIEQVLTGKQKPMTVAEICEAALPLTNLKGQHPKQTFYSILYGENKKTDGLVVKVGPGGSFKLNPKRKKAQAAKAEGEPTKRTRAPRKTAAAQAPEAPAADPVVAEPVAAEATEEV